MVGVGKKYLSYIVVLRIGNKLASQLESYNVEVAYDKDTNSLRIKGTTKGGMKITKNKIGARGILKYFNLEGLKGSFPVKFDEKEKAIFINLNKK